jgi:hypothetical protein
MKKLSRKQRQSQSVPQTRPNYSGILYETVRAEDNDHWRERLESSPLLRYRTAYKAVDVVTLIQAMDETEQDKSPQVYFDHMPTPLEEEGIRYQFYIEYRDFGVRTDPYHTASKKAAHIEGAVISGAANTIIEFRAARAEPEPSNPPSPASWLVLFCISAAVALALRDTYLFEIALAFSGITLFVLIIFFLLWVILHRRDDYWLSKEMRSVITQLEATKIEDDSLKRKAHET